MPITAQFPGLLPMLPLSQREMGRVLKAMCAGLEQYAGQTIPEPELLLTDDAGIAALNCAHLACPGPTNILSFPGRTGQGGSLALSVEMLRRECLLYGQDASEHLVRLLAHGLAHLNGHDHGPEMWEICAMLENEGLAGLHPAGES